MDYSLYRFPESGSQSKVTVNAGINRILNSLSVQYVIRGNIPDILIPEVSVSPQRKNDLWNDTCFEFFLAIKHSTRYWEINLSPSGHWNVYCFDDYRKGMKEETSFDALSMKIRHMRDSFHLFIEVDIGAIIKANEALQASMSVIIKSVSGNLSYYALTHPGPAPDFHNKAGFIIDL